MDGAVRLFRELGRNDLADEVIEHYIDANKGKKDFFNLGKHPFRGDVKDSRVVDRFDEEHDAVKTEKSLKDIVERIAERDSWGREGIKVLREASVDDFYDLFVSEKGPHLSHYVDACLQFGRFSNADDDYKKIAKMAEDALVKIGKESTLNALRISKFGVSLDKDEDVTE